MVDVGEEVEFLWEEDVVELVVEVVGADVESGDSLNFVNLWEIHVLSHLLWQLTREKHKER